MSKLLTLLMVALLVMAMAPPVSAHQGATQTCEASTIPQGQGMKYSSWGCGSAGVLHGNELRMSFDDRLHDHSCVYPRITTVARPEWHTPAQMGVSCGSPAGSPVYHDQASNITGVRIYRYSPYGTNYQTLWD